MNQTRTLPILAASMALWLAPPAFAQSGGEANADVEATAILTASPNPLTVTGMQNINFGEVTIPYSDSVTCNYRVRATVDHLEITRNNEATTPASDLLAAGCTQGAVSPQRGFILLSCQPNAYLQYRTNFIHSGAPGVAANFGDPDDPDNQYVIWLPSTAGSPRCASMTGGASVLLGGLLQVSSNAVPAAGPTTIGTLQVILNYR